ncbi:MAG: carboxypeptidase M32 [Kofleriaceae bacterium]|nr:carboxypeptidase M32 [Myxococcales bacterium]MCB9560152.1 carboxypeptidase M32 [Kofleriaceae bacterium]MCB9571795.1 carboxypeptidase M32 [Kofleriaceae bacterium]
MSAYTELERRFHRLYALRNANNVLQWDWAAMMPTGGAEARAEQVAAIKVVCHEQISDPAVGDLLDRAEEERAGLDAWQAANLAEMRRQWIHETALDARLVEAMSRACSACEQQWRRARPAADFAMVQPQLAEVLALVREAGAAKAARLGCSTYDALLDEFEPGGRAAEIEPVFAHLAEVLPPLRAKVVERQAAAGPVLRPAGPFPVERQRALGLAVMKTLGFDFDHGRLDTSLHPFSGGVPDDVRITTRYDEADWVQALMGVIHETGHAQYERGLPPAWRYQPVGQSRGMSTHEGQSLLMEMQAGRSRAFLDYLAPLAREHLGGDGPAWAPDNLHRLYTAVHPGFIRVDADEVTYPSHVILRFRLERALIGGDLALADLPAAWNAGMQELLGITPPSDREGCLQDIHWYDGAWGYFPTYTLGAMTAAQLYDAAGRALPGLDDAIRGGDFGPLLGWLRANVHGHGSKLSARGLLEHATGRALDPAVFVRHLERRYLG